MKSMMSGDRLTVSDRKDEVRVYDGEGANPKSLTMLMTALNRHVDSRHHEVRTINPEDVIKKTWTEQCGLIAFGGGYGTGFTNALGKEGMLAIRDFVLNGGAYLGIGAGGYFGCSTIEFDKDGPSEKVLIDRDLNFYPGKCIGPAFPGFEYGTRRGAVAATIQCNLPMVADQAMLSPNTVQLYTDGGGYFHSTTPAPKAIEVLGRFSEIPGQPAAIVKCRLGENNGTAILSGSHFEHCPEMLDPSDPTLNKNVMSALFESDKDRQILLTRLLQELGIRTVQ